MKKAAGQEEEEEENLTRRKNRFRAEYYQNRSGRTMALRDSCGTVAGQKRISRAADAGPQIEVGGAVSDALPGEGGAHDLSVTGELGFQLRVDLRAVAGSGLRVRVELANLAFAVARNRQELSRQLDCVLLRARLEDCEASDQLL